MKITFIKPRPELASYIESFWVFESTAGFPAIESSIVAPNGCSRLIIPCENSIVSVVNGQARVSREAGLYFSGNRDSATLLRSSPRKTTFVAIEFSPQGAYPIFGIPMTETLNRLCETDLLLTKWSRPVREALNDRHEVRDKVSVIQEQLVHLLRMNDRRNAIVDYCVQSLRATNGLMPIARLAEKTGYSRRYLGMLFARHVGLAPKVLAGIFRFQKFYRKWAEGQSFDDLKDDLYECYSDQSHFTNEFRRMTGYSPRQFSMQVSNEFGRRLTLR